MQATTQKALRLIASFTLLLMADSSAHARVAPIKLDELALENDGIAVARVDRIVTVGGVRVAEASVTRPLQGMESVRRFAFIAQPTWTCDVSNAVWGETVVLFLTKVRDTRIIDREIAEFFPRMSSQFHSAWVKRHSSLPLYEIADSGRGRLPVHRQEDQSYLLASRREYETEASLWTGDVQLPYPLSSTSLSWTAGRPLPSGLPLDARNDPKKLRLIPLRKVEEAILQCLHRHALMAQMDLDRLTERADAIAVARVTEFVRVGGVCVARATVIRPLKGVSVSQPFASVAQPIGMCDARYSEEPRTAVVFLRRAQPGRLDPDFLQAYPSFPAAYSRRLPRIPLFLIAHAGNGIMEVADESGPPGVYWPHLVRLPAGIPSVIGWANEHLVPLRSLEARVMELVRTAKRKTVNARNLMVVAPVS
jgi:hypothetical protein